MKQIITTFLLLFAALSVSAQISSPYVEPNSSIINNSGFKPIAIRTSAPARPTPMHIQTDPMNASIPLRFAVAKDDVCGVGTWAWANGWTLLSNVGIADGVASVIPTGCAAYAEVGALVGTWRLPTIREMNLIIISRHELAAQPGFTPLSNTTYWISTQLSATSAWVTCADATSFFVHLKKLLLSARCVRDL